MADIELVVKIPEETYAIYKRYKGFMSHAEHLIKDGTPLPKGHGRLIDTDEVLVKLWNKKYDDPNDAIEVAKIINEAPTIIEADREV